MGKQKKSQELLPLFLPPEGGIAGKIQVDPQGSYTGIPEDPEEVPVQDVDDL